MCIDMYMYCLRVKYAFINTDKGHGPVSSVRPVCAGPDRAGS